MHPTDHARPPRANVLGVGVSAINMADALHLSERLLRERRKGYVCLTGVHGIMEAQRDDALRAILNHAFLCAPDGMPTVWVGRLQGHRKHGARLRPRLHDRNVQVVGTGRLSQLSLRRQTVGSQHSLNNNLNIWFLLSILSGLTRRLSGL